MSTSSMFQLSDLMPSPRLTIQASNCTVELIITCLAAKVKVIFLMVIKMNDGDLIPQGLSDILVEQPDQENQDDSKDGEMENMCDVIFEEN